MARELVIISGKGGTGKTSVTASFAVLADRPVIADCDVDAADLHLILSPEVRRRQEFRSGQEAVIAAARCTSCGTCRGHCRFDAIRETHPAGNGAVYVVDPLACEGCGVCARFCPEHAVDLVERVGGEWMVSDTRCGPMVHARLRPAAENSGRLVTAVRRRARDLATDQARPLVLIDGPPGVGCPVMASVTGATQALVVTEPTPAGEHDLGRALSLIGHFGMPAAVCVNKWDLNAEVTERIENMARETGARVVGRIRYDQAVTRAQMENRAVVEIGGAAAEDLRHLWEQMQD